MNLKNVLDAHSDIKKCLTEKCNHPTLSKCMASIATAHEKMGNALADEAEKLISDLQGEIIQKQMAITRKDNGYIDLRSSLELLMSRTAIVE